MKITSLKLQQAKELKKYLESLDEKYGTKKYSISLKTCLRYTLTKQAKEADYVYESELKQNNTKMTNAVNQLLRTAKSSALNEYDQSIPYWRDK